MAIYMPRPCQAATKHQWTHPADLKVVNILHSSKAGGFGVARNSEPKEACSHLESLIF